MICPVCKSCSMRIVTSNFLTFFNKPMILIFSFLSSTYELALHFFTVQSLLVEVFRQTFDQLNGIISYAEQDIQDFLLLPLQSVKIRCLVELCRGWKNLSDWIMWVAPHMNVENQIQFTFMPALLGALSSIIHLNSLLRSYIRKNFSRKAIATKIIEMHVHSLNGLLQKQKVFISK